ncbi:hypothetical protein [Paraburkholderia heleia]|nr:hypothetical protein [Paraburkholderia heleia]
MKGHVCLQRWIMMRTNAYDEYTFVPALNRSIYRRTVDYTTVCLQ